MGLQIPPKELTEFGMRAMKVVAMADGVFEARERAVLQAACDALGVAHDLDALAPINPDELAAAIASEALRNQMIAGLLVVAMADEDVSQAELAAITQFATALGVDSPYVKNMQRIADGHTLIARIDTARRAWALPKLGEAYREKGFGWLVRMLAAFAGLKEDTATASRYRALEQAPAGSLGRGYFDFIRGAGFSFPGEKGSGPEVIILHDMTHVLTGYDTSPAGELQVAFFHAGSKKVDPFFFTFFVLMQFHLEFRMTPVAPGMRGHFDPQKEMKALVRGAASTIDPLDGWDPWAVIDQPLAELRERYRIGSPPA